MIDSTVKSVFTELDGRQAHYLTAGEGPKVITIHGLAAPAGLRAPARRKSVSLLAGHGFEVLSLDLPGFGLSQLDDSIWGVRDYAKWLRKFLDRIPILSTVNLVGTSMGGGVCLLFALQYPKIVNRMAIEGSIGLHLEAFPIDTGQGRRPEDFIRRMFHDQRIADEYLAEGVLENSFDENRGFTYVTERILPDHPIDLAIDLPRLATPTLVLWGENDQIAPVTYAYEFGRLLPNAKVYVIPKCGHLPQIEKPLESHRAIAEFLKGRIP